MQVLPLRTLAQPLRVQVFGPKQTHRLRSDVAMTAGHELVQPIDQYVLQAEEQDLVPAAERDLLNLLVLSGKARRRLDEEVVLREDPVPSFFPEAELRQEIVDGRAMREVEIDVGGRVRTVCPELDREPADHDRPPLDELHELIDQRDDRELALGLVLERERCFEVLAARSPRTMLSLASSRNILLSIANTARWCDLSESQMRESR